ncbi:MAG: hypothetical protein KGK11_12205 [Sphingomonadales bacterium]|nr:hypothetical protein [Sphingomonadales bacterium]
MRLAGFALLSLCGLALAGCGVRTDLKPAPGHLLPKPPYGRADPRTSGELLSVAPQSRPGYDVELLLKSDVRTDDPFDLPPQ